MRLSAYDFDQIASRLRALAQVPGITELDVGTYKLTVQHVDSQFEAFYVVTAIRSANPQKGGLTRDHTQ